MVELVSVDEVSWKLFGPRPRLPRTEVFDCKLRTKGLGLTGWLPAVLRMLGGGLRIVLATENLWYRRLPDNNEKKFWDECRFLHLPSLGGRLLILSFLPSNHLLSQPGMTFLSLVLCHQFDSILIMYLCHELNYMYVDITKLVWRTTKNKMTDLIYIGRYSEKKVRHAIRKLKKNRECRSCWIRDKSVTEF